VPNHRPARALPPARFALQLAGDLFPTPVQPSQKKRLSERDICTKFITPAITGGGKWDVMSQVSEEVYLTKGRVIVRGQLTSRGDPKRADYVLYHKPGIPLAVVEAKDNNHTVGAGMQQALGYAELLDVPFAFSSNGDADFHTGSGKV